MDLLTGLLVVLGNAAVSALEAFVVFQLGKKYGAIGRAEAYSLRDSAMEAIGRFDTKFVALKAEIMDKINALPTPPDLKPLEKKLDALAKAEITLSDEEIKKVAQSVSLSLRGAAGAEKQKVTKEMMEAQMASMTPEQLEAMENAEFARKFRNGLLKLLPGSED